MGLFAQTFSPILASSSNGSSLVSGTPSGSSVYVHQAGTAAITFVVKTSSGTGTYKITWTNKSNLQVPTPGTILAHPEPLRPLFPEQRAD